MKTRFLLAFRLLETQDCFVCSIKCNFDLIFFKEEILILMKKWIKSSQTSRVHTKFSKSTTPRNTLCSIIFFIPNSTLDELLSDITHSSLR